MQRILVLRGGALGDFIVTLPALARLRQRWPAAHIELVGNATAAQLGRSRGLLDAVWSQHEARWSALFADAPLRPELAAWFASFDLVINYWPDPDRTLRGKFPFRAGQTFLSHAPIPVHTPAAAHFCEPLNSLGLASGSFDFRLRPLVLPSAPNSTQGHPIFVHPGSGSERKNWPMENWRQLLPLLPTPVVVLLGEAELARGISSATFAAPEVQTHLHPPLEELVARFSQCRLFLGHDSGISHLAAACGAKCVLLFGPTDPLTWAPPSPRVRVVRGGEALTGISVAEVRRVVAE